MGGQSLLHLLDDSLNQYAEMKGILVRLAGELDSNEAVLTSLLQRLDQVQREAREKDAVLLRSLQGHEISDEELECLRRRQELLADLTGAIGEIVPRANNIKALLADERQSISKGRRAMTGYRNGLVQAGGRILRSSG